MVRFVQGLLFTLVCIIIAVKSNVEKVIFVAPETTQSKDIRDFAALPLLSRKHPTHRTYLPVAFPTADLPYGLQSWYLLVDLIANQRHEVRICWPATQPSVFALRQYSLAQLARNPNLLSSVSEYKQSLERESRSDRVSILESHLSSGQSLDTTQTPISFLQILAAAEFYTTNHTLMTNPPPVLVDIILDPYILNIFPRSLLPTAVYLVLISIGSWHLSHRVWKWLSHISRAAEDNVGPISKKHLEDMSINDVHPQKPSPTARAIPVQKHPFQSLPLDLILVIIDLLSPMEFISFAFAFYPVLKHHGLVPAVTSPVLRQLHREVRHTSYSSRVDIVAPPGSDTADMEISQVAVGPQTMSQDVASPNGEAAHIPLPAELLIQTISLLSPIDKMSFVLSHFVDLRQAGVAPALTTETLKLLEME